MLLCWFEGAPWSMDCKQWAQSAHTPCTLRHKMPRTVLSASTGIQTADDHGADSPGGKLESGLDWTNVGAPGAYS